MSRITWGIDKHGNKAYICEHCSLYFGIVDRDTIIHDCDTSLPRYNQHGVFADERQREIDAEIQRKSEEADRSSAES